MYRGQTMYSTSQNYKYTTKYVKYTDQCTKGTIKVFLSLLSRDSLLVYAGPLNNSPNRIHVTP